MPTGTLAFWKGLVKYTPNKETFSELMLLKECTYSRMIDYDSPDFKEVLTSRGTGKGNITPIMNLEAAYKAAGKMEINTPDLSRICGITLNGESENNPIDVRDHQTFWLGAKTNLKGYNPTAPDAVLPALADISTYLYNDHNTDPLIKATLVHYQFEMIHPFERYNGIVGRILVPMILRDVIGEARPLICLSEHLCHNKNEYFDLLRSTQYSGGYIRWIKFFAAAVGLAVKQSVEILIRHEQLVTEDREYLRSAGKIPKSVILVYEYLIRYLIVDASFVAKSIGLSFNSVSKALHMLQKHSIIVQSGDSERNRIWIHRSLDSDIHM